MDVQSKFARYVNARDAHPAVRANVLRKRPARREPLHPAIPRVLCPSCGEMMRLCRVDDSHRGETMMFECSCGDDYRQTIRERL